MNDIAVILLKKTKDNYLQSMIRRNIAGKPFYIWAIDSAINANVFSKVIVIAIDWDTSKDISLQELDLDIIECNTVQKKYENDSSILIDKIMDLEFNSLTAINVTMPLTLSSDFRFALNLFRSNKMDSLLTAVKIEKRLCQTTNGTSLTFKPPYKNGELMHEELFVENNAFYIAKKEVLQKYKSLLGGRIGIYEMPWETSITISNPENWDIVEGLLLRHKRDAELKKLKQIKLLAFDCDGVLTDAGMYYGENGEELKKFNTRDGQGIETLRSNGFITALITKENSKVARNRAEKLKIDNVFVGIKDKTKPMKILLNKYGLEPKNIAYIGDDIGDIPAMEIAGVTFAVNDAVIEVKKKADFVTQLSGGQGAVREVCDLLLCI